MVLELLVLGAGPAYSDDIGSVGSAYLVREGLTRSSWIWARERFRRLAHSVEPSGLKGVFISHLHPDHFIDLIPLRHYLSRAEFHPGRRLRVVAPDGLERRLDATYDVPGFASASFDVESLAGREYQAGRFVGRGASGSSRGRVVRVPRQRAPTTADPGIVYSGDCADAAALLPADPAVTTRCSPRRRSDQVRCRPGCRISTARQPGVSPRRRAQARSC